jgi:hypothetical protein
MSPTSTVTYPSYDPTAAQILRRTMRRADGSPAVLGDLLASFDTSTSDALPPCEVFGDDAVDMVLRIAEAHTSGRRPVSCADLEAAVKEACSISIPYLRFVRYLTGRAPR